MKKRGGDMSRGEMSTCDFRIIRTYNNGDVSPTRIDDSEKCEFNSNKFSPPDITAITMPTWLQGPGQPMAIDDQSNAPRGRSVNVDDSVGTRGKVAEMQTNPGLL
jgi:hypothetical protein